jgi:hypothetical protein
MNDAEKLQVLLPHWIEHQAEHAAELRTWAGRLQYAGQADVADKLLAAAASLQDTVDLLTELLPQKP